MIHGRITKNDAFEFRDGDTIYHFYPQGWSNNPPDWRADMPLKAKESEHWGGGLSGRLFVGLNVGDAPVYEPEDVLQMVLELRREQVMGWLRKGIVSGGREGSVQHGGSVVPQLGYWEKVTSTHGEESPVERSVVVEILNFPIVGFKLFVKAMSEVARKLGVQMMQQAVTVQIFEGGLQKDGFNVYTENE